MLSCLRSKDPPRSHSRYGVGPAELTALRHVVTTLCGATAGATAFGSTSSAFTCRRGLRQTGVTRKHSPEGVKIPPRPRRTVALQNPTEVAARRTIKRNRCLAYRILQPALGSELRSVWVVGPFRRFAALSLAALKQPLFMTVERLVLAEEANLHTRVVVEVVVKAAFNCPLLSASP